MKQALLLLLIGVATYGAYRGSLDLYTWHRSEVDRAQYHVTRRAIDDAMHFHSGFLLEYPPESRRRYQEN